MAIDAAKVERVAKYVNHSSSEANAAAKRRLDDNGHVMIVITAILDIAEGEEITYDYGEHRRDVVRAFPWLAKKKAKVKYKRMQ